MQEAAKVTKAMESEHPIGTIFLIVLVVVMLLLAGLMLTRANRLAHQQNQVVEYLDSLAARLRGPVQKYPTKFAGNDTFLRAWRLQERYLAVSVPLIEESGLEKEDPPPEMQGWTESQLGWWESADAYGAAEPPKGAIQIASITEAILVKAGQVIIRYEVGHSQHELVLQFSTPLVAEQWWATLQEFLKALGKLNGGMPEALMADTSTMVTSYSDPGRIDDVPPNSIRNPEEEEDDGNPLYPRFNRVKAHTVG